MDLESRGLTSLTLYSSNSKSTFIRCLDQNPIPATLFLDSLIPRSSFPAQISYRVLASLILQSSEGTNITESAYKTHKVLKCFDSTSEFIYFIYYSTEPTLQSLVLARYNFNEIYSDPKNFVSDLARLAIERVKDIRFKNNAKNSQSLYKDFFQQLVQTVNNQQIEILDLQREIGEIKAKEDKEKAEESENEQIAKCIICEREQRNVIFVPCGHLIVCLKCLGENLKLDTGVEELRKCVSCLACKKVIKIAHEVYF